MQRNTQFNLAGNFLHVGSGEYVPMQNIRSVEVLSETDKSQMVERYPDARQDFQYRIQFADRSQKLIVDLDSAPGSFVQVDDGVLVPISNMQGLKPLSDSAKAQLKTRYPQAERDFQTRIEGAFGQSFLSTWTVAQITGMPDEKLMSAPAPKSSQNGNGNGRGRRQAQPAAHPAG